MTGDRSMTLDERVKAAVEEAHYSGFGLSRADVLQLLDAFAPELFTTPLTGWIAPWDPDESMTWSGAATHDHPSVFMGGPSQQGRKTSVRIYAAMRDAHLKANVPASSAEGEG